MVTFDKDGFATNDGLVTVYVTDSQGIYLHSEEEFVSIGTTISANSYIEQPPAPKAGFAIKRNDKGWEYIEDHRNEIVYSTVDKSEIKIDTFGPYPDNTTTLKPACEYCEWDGQKWTVSAEKQAEIKLLQQEQMREKINALRDEKINGGVYVPELNKWFDSDARAERSLNSVKSTFDLLGEIEIDWTCADNTQIKLNKANLILVWKALLHAQQQNHANALHHKAEMMKAENPLNYDYSAGWTEVYGG
ncbi:DUF4376 domain-containing protein [Pasteurella multocida]|uniref:DUF4376 domain-containing protein n=1 Tax=Pasteurella multocida TaxID=747 RepID=UPI00292EBC2E|nr:DUF4376 domain-containing protein [Pasteurella multocida]